MAQIDSISYLTDRASLAEISECQLRKSRRPPPYDSVSKIPVIMQFYKKLSICLMKNRRKERQPLA